MPRPETITSADTTRWELDRQEGKMQGDALSEKASRNYPQEAYYSSCWLCERLAEAGCEAELRSKICFAMGQRQAFADDVWAPAIVALENYRNGVWEEPGAELGDRIMREVYGPNPDPIVILRDLVARGVDVEGAIKNKLKMPKTPWEK